MKRATQFLIFIFKYNTNVVDLITLDMSKQGLNARVYLQQLASLCQTTPLRIGDDEDPFSDKQAFVALLASCVDTIQQHQNKLKRHKNIPRLLRDLISPRCVIKIVAAD